MPVQRLNAPLAPDAAQVAVAAVEAAIADGAVYPLARGQTGRSAVKEAASALGLVPSTLFNRLRRADQLYGLRPDGIAPPDRIPPKPRVRRSAKTAQPPPDPVHLHRATAEMARLRAEAKGLAARASAAERLREQVFGLVSDPPPPVHFGAADDGRAASPETIVLFLSDLHWGERVNIEALDGLNAYDLGIARARLARWARAVTDLATRHWSGPPPARVVLILGGDLVSGEIHAELAKTNEAKALPAVRDMVPHLAAAIRLICAEVGCPVDVISLPGNHGRATMKPESKQAAETSYDTLVCDFLESVLRTDPGIVFHKPVSGDALFHVHGWRVLATHGDRIGSRGGTGFIGPAATAARGFKRMAADYAVRGQMPDLILIGHFHTPLMLEEGFVNGSLVGPSEFSRDGRFRPHPAQQLFLTMHPRRRVAQVRWIDVGHPDEGSLYAAPDPAPPKPRYRIPAVTRAGDEHEA